MLACAITLLGDNKYCCAPQSAEVAAEWALRINGAVLRHAPQRPGALLVLVNPFGGARRARRTWRRTAEPIFEAAGEGLGRVKGPSFLNLKPSLRPLGRALGLSALIGS